MNDSPERSFAVRTALSSDVSFLREMLHLALYVHDGEPPFPESVLDEPQLRHYFEGFGGQPGDLGVVAVDGVRPVGACWLRVFERDDPGYGWVDDDVPELTVAVREGARDRGLGTRLIETVIRRAAARGTTRVSLSVDPRSPALRLYERLGFAQAGREGTSITLVREVPPLRSR